MTTPSRPNYPEATRTPPAFILNHLNQTYGEANVVWPTIVSRITGGETAAYVCDRNGLNLVNSDGDNRPVSKLGVPNAFLDYTAEPRELPEGANPELQQMISPRHNRIYDFMVDGASNQSYTAADIDFVWHTGERWKGMEFTTFYVDFASESAAHRLLSMMNRRPSWRGEYGPVAMANIIQAAEDLEIDLTMVCVNTVGQASNAFRTDGNAYWFPLNAGQLQRLVGGMGPANASFGTVQQMLASL